MKVTAKIKIFGWRALKGLLPCRAILANRHVGDSGGCPVCQSGAEDITHMIFTCERAKKVWRSLGIEEKIQSLTLTDRSEERRVGKECSVTCRSRWSPYH